MYSLGTETDRLFRSRSGGYWRNDFYLESEGAWWKPYGTPEYGGTLTYDMNHTAVTVADGFFGPGSDHLWEDLHLDVVGIRVPTSIRAEIHAKASAGGLGWS